MSKKANVNVIKGPHFEHVEKMAYGYLNKVLSEMAMTDAIADDDKGTSKTRKSSNLSDG